MSNIPLEFMKVRLNARWRRESAITAPSRAVATKATAGRSAAIAQGHGAGPPATTASVLGIPAVKTRTAIPVCNVDRPLAAAKTADVAASWWDLSTGTRELDGESDICVICREVFSMVKLMLS